MFPRANSIWRFGSLALFGLAALCAASPSLCHEDEGGAARVAEAVAPGMTAMGVLILVAVVLALWYHFRREAMLRASRERQDASSGSGGRPSATP